MPRVTGERTWDRVGAAAGVAVIPMAVLGLALGSGGAQGARPAYGAPADEIAGWMTRPASPTAFVSDALLRLTFVFLLLFFARLWATLRQAEGGTGWLSTAGLAGGVVYVVLDLARFVVGEARTIGGGHLASPEALTLFDISNALTPFTWTAIGMFMLPTSIVAVRARALPAWLGWAGILIGAANLAYGSLPPVGSATPAELAFLAWVLVTGVVLLRRPLTIGPTPDLT